MPTDPTPTLPTSVAVPEHERRRGDEQCGYLLAGKCYWCCDRCSYDTHQCGGCGENVDHNGRQADGTVHNATGRKCYE